MIRQSIINHILYNEHNYLTHYSIAGRNLNRVISPCSKCFGDFWSICPKLGGSLRSTNCWKFPKLCPKKSCATRYTSDTKVLRRGVALYQALVTVDAAKMYFKNNANKSTYETQLGTWRMRSRYYLQFIFPFYERIELWIVLTEYGSRVTVSLILYLIDDLNGLVEDITRQVN